MFPSSDLSLSSFSEAACHSDVVEPKKKNFKTLKIDSLFYATPRLPCNFCLRFSMSLIETYLLNLRFTSLATLLGATSIRTAVSTKSVSKSFNLLKKKKSNGEKKELSQWEFTSSGDTKLYVRQTEDVCLYGTNRFL